MRRKFFSVMLIMQLAMAVAAKPSRVNPEARRYTVRLPAIDKVVLEKFKTPETSIESIAATKVLEGSEAKAVAALWRSQNYRSIAAICHYPPFGVKFYSKGRLVAYASVCWECDNIVFVTPKLKAKQGFDGTSNKGKELLAVFTQSFPQ